MPHPVDHQAILGSEERANGILFVLFIPSRDRNGDPLPPGEDQNLWAEAAGDLLTKAFGGATIMPPAKGKWHNDETGKVVTEEIVLVHSYVQNAHAEDKAKLGELRKFLHRMGKKTRQGEVAVVIGEVFHRIREFKRS